MYLVQVTIREERKGSAAESERWRGGVEVAAAVAWR